MADEDRIGKPWNDDELDAIVADYFVMLRAELSRQHYVKSHHSAVLMQQIGRTHRSVEFKHQNISAVLEEMGLPWIIGYKPSEIIKHRFLAQSIAICRPTKMLCIISYLRTCSHLPMMVSHLWMPRNWSLNPIGLGSSNGWLENSIL
jgi:hypothetical protein